MRPGVCTTRRAPSRMPGMKLLWCRESCRTVRVSPSPPSRTSWWASRPRRRTEWTGMPSTSAPRAPSRAVSVASGAGAVPAARRDSAMSWAVRVDLLRVVQLDDLDRLEVGRGDLRELHVQDGPDGEVRRDEHARLRGGGQPAVQLREALVGPARRTDDRVDAAVHAVVEVGHHRVRRGQFDGDLGARLRQGLQLVAPAQGGDQLHVLGGLDRPHRLGADPALGAEDRHAQLAHLCCFLTSDVPKADRVRPRRRSAGTPACPSVGR